MTKKTENYCVVCRAGFFPVGTEYMHTGHILQYQDKSELHYIVCDICMDRVVNYSKQKIKNRVS